MRALLPTIALLSLGSCVFIMNDQVKATVSRDYEMPAANIQTLRVETYNGSIFISEGSASRVECTADFYASASTQADAEAHLTEMTVTSSRDGDTLFLKVPKHSKLGTNNNGAKLRLKVPAGIEVDLFSSNGSVEAEIPFHAPQVRTSNGNVTVQALSGPVSVKTSNGVIVVDDWQAPTKAELTSSNGAVYYTGGALDFNIQTSNGSVKLQLPDGWDGNGVVHTSNSNVTVDCQGTIHAKVSTRTSNGSSRVSGADADGDGRLKIETSNGNIRVNHGG